MKKVAWQASVAALVLVFGSTTKSFAQSHGTNGHNLLLSQLFAACRRGGGPAFADFENVPGHRHGQQVLRLAAQTTTATDNANGEAGAFVVNVSGITFESIGVHLTGDCQQGTTGWFEVFVTYTSPGSSIIQGSSFQCQDMQVQGHPGTLLLTPLTTSSNGDESIPAGSTLQSLGINEQCDLPFPRLLQVFVSGVTVNSTGVGFDHTAPSASCSAP